MSVYMVAANNTDHGSHPSACARFTWLGPETQHALAAQLLICWVTVSGSLYTAYIP